MADSGGQPQLTQVSTLPTDLGMRNWDGLLGSWAVLFATSETFMVSNHLSLFSFLVMCPQPGKLTEAFKYFLQGMGYSEYWDRGF